MLNVKAETNMAEQPLEEAISLGQSDVGGSTKMLKWKVLHTNRKPFKCPEPYCFKTYRFQGSVSKHQKQVHQGEKLFKCPEEGCFKAFKFKCHLNKHRLMHTKVDLFGEKLLKEVKQEIFNGVKQIFNEVALQESVKDEVAGLKFVKEEKVQELVKEKQLESEGSY